MFMVLAAGIGAAVVPAHDATWALGIARSFIS
jgi:hypothetical protein